MNHNKIIIDRLYYFLRKRNMTINRLADLSGIRQSTLSNIVNRESVPKIDTLFKICEALDITVLEFLDIEPYNNAIKEQLNPNDIVSNLNQKQLEKLSEFIEALREDL